MASGTERHRWPDLIEQGPAGLRETLIETTRADLHEARAALCAGNFEQAAFIAHRMKGSARLLESHATVAACLGLETRCRQRDAAQSGTALRQVEYGFEAAFQALDASGSAAAGQHG
jgi:histidine phosphotransfer protein HptB